MKFCVKGTLSVPGELCIYIQTAGHFARAQD